MKENDELELLIGALKKREQILINGESVKKYNRCFDIMRKHARNLIKNNRQEELLPYLECDSVSIRRDVFGFSEEEMNRLKDVVESTAHLILRYSKEGEYHN